MMEELDQLYKTPGFRKLLKLVDAQRQVTMRQVLSHHGTWACQPGKTQDGHRRSAWSSLSECGLDTLLPGSEGQRDVEPDCGCSFCRRSGARTEPKYYVMLRAGNMFVAGDGLEWIYESATWHSRQAAVHHACLEVLAFLLVVGPLAVHLHEHTVADAAALRRAALEVRRQFLESAPPPPRAAGTVERSWTCALVPETLAEATRPPPRTRAQGLYQPLAAGETEQRRDEEVLSFLRAALSLEVWHNPSRVPSFVRMLLAARVPRKGLRALLERRGVPVRDAAGVADSWMFKLPRQSGPAADGALPSTAALQPPPLGPAQEAPWPSWDEVAAAAASGVSATETNEPTPSGVSSWDEVSLPAHAAGWPALPPAPSGKLPVENRAELQEPDHGAATSGDHGPAAAAGAKDAAPPVGADGAGTGVNRAAAASGAQAAAPGGAHEVAWHGLVRHPPHSSGAQSAAPVGAHVFQERDFVKMGGWYGHVVGVQADNRYLQVQWYPDGSRTWVRPGWVEQLDAVEAAWFRTEW